MRLVKYLAHAGVASRRAAETLIAAGRVSVGRARWSPTRRATSTRTAAWRVDGRRARRARAARHLRAAQAGRRRLDRARHARAPDGRSAWCRRSGLRLYPVGRLDADTQRPDPADQRRRARQPADAPALRGAEDLPRRRSGGRRDRRARRWRGCARASSSRTGVTAPARVRRVGRARARADDPRGPQPPGAAHVRGGRSSGARAAPRALRPAAARTACARASTGGSRDELRELGAAAPSALTESPRCDCSPCAAPISVERNDAQRRSSTRRRR